MARVRAATIRRKPVPAWLLDGQVWASRHDEALAHCEQYDIAQLTLLRYQRCLRLGDMSTLDDDDRAEISTWELLAETLPEPVQG